MLRRGVQRVGAVAVGVLAGTLVLIGAASPASAVPRPASAVAQPAGVAASPSWHAGYCYAGQPNSVTVVVDFGDLGGSTLIRCVTGVSSNTTGYDVLRYAQLDPVGTQSDGPTYICRLGGKPSAAQVVPLPTNKNYTENCQNTPPYAAYWSYWHAPAGGSWGYSTRGPGSSPVTPGTLEGWSFVHSSTNSMPKPRAPGASTALSHPPAPPTTSRTTPTSTHSARPSSPPTSRRTSSSPATTRTTPAVRTTTDPRPTAPPVASTVQHSTATTPPIPSTSRGGSTSSRTRSTPVRTSSTIATASTSTASSRLSSTDTGAPTTTSSAAGPASSSVAISDTQAPSPSPSTLGDAGGALAPTSPPGSDAAAGSGGGTTWPTVLGIVLLVAAAGAASVIAVRRRRAG